MASAALRRAPVCIRDQGFASDRALRAALAEAPPDPSYASFRELKGLGNALVCPSRAVRPFVGFEQDAGATLLARRTFALADPFKETTPLLGRKGALYVFPGVR